MATLRELLGENYKEGMIFEESEKALFGKKLKNQKKLPLCS